MNCKGHFFYYFVFLILAILSTWLTHQASNWKHFDGKLWGNWSFFHIFHHWLFQMAWHNKLKWVTQLKHIGASPLHNFFLLLALFSMFSTWWIFKNFNALYTWSSHVKTINKSPDGSLKFITWQNGVNLLQT